MGNGTVIGDEEPLFSSLKWSINLGKSVISDAEHE